MDNDIKSLIIGDNVDDKFNTLENYYGNDILAMNVLKSKYLTSNEDNLLDLWARLAWGAAQIENDEDKINIAKSFFNILLDFKFIPGGRISFALGRDDINASLSNCYVIPVEDSIKGIYKALEEEALTHKFGGGTGHDLSTLRPKGAQISGTGGESCGPCGFMDLYSTSTKTIRQHGRRGANMQCIFVNHPDIKEFVCIKNEAKKQIEFLQKFSNKLPRYSKELNSLYEYIDSRRAISDSNISVKITDEFLSAVENDQDFNLSWGGEIYEVVKAKDIWDMIIDNAYNSGEPGIMFWDRMRETNNLEYYNPITSTNPCSEIPLGNYGNCLLGHINLQRYCRDNKTFDFVSMDKDIKIAMRFLDNIITINNGRHPLKKQNEIALAERRTGLGITGLGDCLIMMGLKYGSDESIQFIEHLMATFRNTAYSASCDLAEEKGPFPVFNEEGFFRSLFAQRLPSDIKKRIRENGIRNGMLLTVAPVGSGSIVSGVSSGIEPIFRTKYIRRVRNDDDEYVEYKVIHPMIKKMFGDADKLPNYVVDSSEIDAKDRVKMQATIQKYIDNSISSTVNLPIDATVKDVEDVYMYAWKLGVKGITVYREGTRKGILLSKDSFAFINNNGLAVEEAIKRPLKLNGETYKRKLDINGKPHNCYITVNFFPGTKTPYELLVSEPHMDKDIKDIISLELATRFTSICLRHGIPLKFVIQQLEKISHQYLYSIPISIANILRNYLINNSEEYEEASFKICPECNEKTLRLENGCCLCINEACQYTKCN